MSNVCNKHGQLERSCEICELEARIQELEQDVAQITTKEDFIQRMALKGRVQELEEVITKSNEFIIRLDKENLRLSLKAKELLKENRTLTEVISQLTRKDYIAETLIATGTDKVMKENLYNALRASDTEGHRAIEKLERIRKVLLNDSWYQVDTEMQLSLISEILAEEDK